MIKWDSKPVCLAYKINYDLIYRDTEAMILIYEHKDYHIL